MLFLPVLITGLWMGGGDGGGGMCVCVLGGGGGGALKRVYCTCKSFP